MSALNVHICGTVWRECLAKCCYWDQVHEILFLGALVFLVILVTRYLQGMRREEKTAK
jgi:hypothetical protein